MNCELVRSALVPAAAYGVRGESELAELSARSAIYDKMSPPTGKEKLVTQKVNEQRGNVIEKKGSAFNSLGLSGNVIENKGSYALKAGILLKRKAVNFWGVVGRRS